MRLNSLTRRRFVQGLGQLSAFGGIASGRTISATSLLASKQQGSAYVGRNPGDEVLVFAVQGDRWTPIQSIQSSAPISMALSPDRRFLFVVNGVSEHEGLPRGTVEAYSVGPKGRLKFLNRQPLSLSAVKPRHAIVSPDGQQLVIAVYGGGSYNVLPIEADGALGRVASIRKEVGCGPDIERQTSAHPHSLAFDSSGTRLFGSDLGVDRINLFSLQNGCLQGETRFSTAEGFGPSELAVHPSKPLLYVLNELAGSLSVYSSKGTSDGSFQEIQRIRMGPGGVPGSLAMDPLGRFLIASHAGAKLQSPGVSVWTISESDTLVPQAQGCGEPCAALELRLTNDGSRLYALDAQRQAVVSGDLMRRDKASMALRIVAEVANPVSLALRLVS